MNKILTSENAAGGIDLTLGRDAGNEITILTGNAKNSLSFWRRLQTRAKYVIEDLTEGEPKAKAGAKYHAKCRDMEPYDNPYGGGMKYGPWRTLGAFGTVDEAQDAIREKKGLFDKAVFFKGKRLL